MNQRGSTLVNVLIVITILMIVGLLAMQIVLADANFAIININGAKAFQLAEGGLDYGIELLVSEACEFGQEYDLSIENEGDITVTIEPHPTLKHHYEITSTGRRKSTTRTHQLVVKYYPWENAFSHSFFVGDEGETMILNNVVILGDTYIGTKTVDLKHIYFKGNTHFAGETVTISNSCDKDILVQVTRGPHTVINSPKDGHWSDFIVVDDVYLAFPEIDIERFRSAEGFHDWGKKQTINYSELKALNFFDGDIEVIVNRDLGLPADPEITIASTGEAKFTVVKQLNSYNATLIILANDDIVGVDKLTPGATPNEKDKPNKESTGVQLYLYSKYGRIETTQNIRLRAVFARDISIQCSQYQTIQEPDFSKINDLIHDVWRTSVTPISWTN